MTYVERLKHTTSPQQAMLVLAQGLDDLQAQLKDSVPAADEWGSWDAVTSPEGGSPAPVTASPSPFEPIIIPVDPAEVERVQGEYDDANEHFEKVRLTGDKAMIMQAAARVEGLRGRLDLAKNPGSIMPVSGDMVGDPDKVFHVDLTPENIMVDLPPASPQRQVRRRAMAEQLDLPGFFPIVMRTTEEARQGLIDAYVKGGPFWIYMDNRDLIMQMPMWARQEMVEDVNEIGDVRLAHEFARDVMKTEDEKGGTLDIAEANIHSIADHGGAPFQGNGEG